MSVDLQHDVTLDEAGALAPLVTPAQAAAP